MQNASKLWYLEQFDMTKLLCKNQQAHLSEMMVMKHFKKDDPIMFPYNSKKSVYLLKKGTVKIGSYTDHGEENLKYILNEGNIFGEMALVDGNADDFAIALEDTIVCVIELSLLEDMMQRNKKFNAHIYKIIGWRLRRLERKMSAMIFKDSSTRIKDFLQEWGDDFGKQDTNALVLKNVLTHREIAKLTFTSRQTVSAVLSKLK
ncbi:MAG: Crp/Fnr family transcriptional regulator, partial [Saprospiraceae bacterium]|nr:Crp/Fnr family transcriptional regulator [Saprospiraceae bacterium]